MNDVIETLAAAQRYARDNPELHAELLRRECKGEWIKPSETELYKFSRELSRLNLAAVRAVLR